MENKEIRFIDSHYNELFRIPDGGQITIHYPDGHKENRVCQYIDDYHTYINGVCFHICQFAEIMEHNKQTYTPAETEKYILENVTQEEFEFMFAPDKKDTERGSIGYLRVDFDSGSYFFSSWFDETPNLKTNEFKAEFDDMINYFRKNASTPLLKSRSDMYNTCYLRKPTVYKENEELRGFKVQTEKYTYYLKCNPRQGEYNLYCYCYNTSLLEKFKNLQFVNGHLKESKRDKFFISEGKVTEVYYNPDSTAGGQLVYNEIYDYVIKDAAKNTSSKNEFFNIINSECTQYLIDVDAAEFKGNFESFINRKADFEGCTDKTMKGLKKFAGVEKAKPPKEPER